MKDYLNIIITSPCGTMEWQAQGIAVPQIGASVTCRGGRDHREMFSGIVSDVHYEVRMGVGVLDEGISTPGMIVSVWLKEDE